MTEVKADEAVAIEENEPPEGVRKLKPPVVTPREAAADTKKKAVRKKKIKSKDGIITLDNGKRVKFIPVAANIMVEAQARIPDPLMRTFKHPTTGKDTPNPGHPEYLKEQAEVERLKNQASMDALLLFGLELLDPIPEDDLWLQKLHFVNLVSSEELKMATTGAVFMRELLYKKFVVADATVLNEIAKLSGVTEEMLAQARKSFRSDKAGSAD